MNKKNIILTIIATVIMFFAGCDKVETVKPVASNSFSGHPKLLVFPAFSGLNPFDENKGYIDEMFQEAISFISKIDENPEYEDFKIYIRDFDKIMERFKNSPYPKFDFYKFNESDQKIIIDLIENYMDNIKKVGLVEASNQIEKMISLISDENLQQSMFSVVSQMKFTRFIMDNMGEILMQSEGWENRWRSCMRIKYNQYYESCDNPIDWAVWFAYNVNPLNGLVNAASCAWNATFNHSACYPPK